MAWEKVGNVRGPVGPRGPKGDPGADGLTEAEVTEVVEGVLTEEQVVRFTDPGIPSENQWPNDPAYALREMDALGRMTRGIRATDGAQHMPIVEVDELRLAGAGFVVPAQPGSGVAVAFTDADGRMSDLAIGEDGHFLPHTMEHIADHVNGGGSGGFDIVVAAGQSNAMRTGYLELPNCREQDARLFMWNGTGIVQLPATDVSLGSEFARAYARSTAATGRRVLVVFAGVGSIGFTTTSLDPAPAGYRTHASGTWDRALGGDTKNRYAAMVNLVNGAKAAGGSGTRVAALLWSQGEADGGLTQAEYSAKLDDLIGAARTAWSAPILPVVVGSMTPEMHSDHPGFEHIARALADTPRRVERCGFVWGPTNGHRYNQTVHFSYSGQIDRAGRMAREGLLEALANAAGTEPVPPLGMRVTRSGNIATVQWDRPLCHVDSLTVEFSTNAGATWSPATVDTMHGSVATATVPAATAVVFRITVTNAVGATMPALVNG